MFSKTLKELRKRRGMTQEELAVRINVTRQTISKWEKGFSVPDADLLIRLAETLETDVSALLGAGQIEETTQNALAEQLARINEQLAIRNRRARRIWRVVVTILISIAAFWTLLIGLAIAGVAQYDSRTEQTEQTEIVEE